MTIINRFLLAICFIFLTACTTSARKAYDGPEQPKNQLSIIGCGFGITIKSIDGNTSHHGTDFSCDHALTPGIHRVTFNFYKNDHVLNGTWVYKEGGTVEFNTSKGFRYSLHGFSREDGWLFRVLSVSQERDKEGKALSKSFIDYHFINKNFTESLAPGPAP